METICQVQNVSRLDWAKPVATILGHRNAWFPVNSRGRCTTPSCCQIHWNECNAWRTTNFYQENHMTAEIPITSSKNTIKSNQIKSNQIKSNHHNFKPFNFQGLCCLNRSVWSQEQVHSTSGFTSGCHTFAFLEGVTWESPRSQQGPPPTLKVAKTSKHVTIFPTCPSIPFIEMPLKW